MFRPLFNCSLCQMNFDDASSLANHKNNFCAGSVLHPFKTEKSYQNQKLNQSRVSQHDSVLLSSTILNSTVPELLQQNEDEYQSLRRRINQSQSYSTILPDKNMSQFLNQSNFDQTYTESFAKLSDNMSRVVRQALFGHDKELEELLREVRERSDKEREYFKDKDVIERELQVQKRKMEQAKSRELENLLNEREMLQEKYEHFIMQAQNVLNQKTAAGGAKENLDRLVTLKKIKEQIENDRARIMSSVFQIQTGDFDYGRRNGSSLIAAQNILNQVSPALPPPSRGYSNPQQNMLDYYWNPPDMVNESYYDPEQIKMDASQIDRNQETANKLANEIKMYMQGLDPALQKHAESHGTSIFDTMFSDNKEDYQQMSTEEKKLITLIAQEADSKRALERIPYGTDIYFQKLQQVNQIGALRASLEKTVQEQKYARIREGYDRVNRDDEDMMRRTKIRQRLLGQMDSWRAEKKYQPHEGLVIHWDWCLNVPKKYEKCKLTWGVFLKGQTLHKPSFVEDHMCASDGYRVNYCMFGEHNFVYDIVANKDIILVIEMQCHYRDDSMRRKMDVYGWTIHELFDLNQNLIRGKFKLPFYSSSTNPSQLIAQDKPLKSVSNTMLYLRVSFPFDYEYGKEEPLNPAALTQEYYLTGIHAKSQIRADNDHIKVPLRKRGYNPLAFDELFNKKAEIIEEKEEAEIIEEEQKEDEWKLRELTDNRQGIYLNVHEILNYFTQTKSKVRCFLTDVTRGVIKDEKGVPCSFETDPYDGQEAQTKSSRKMDSILNGPFVFIEEEYQFFVDLDTYAHNNRAWDDLFLIFQVFDLEEEVLEEEESKDDRSMDQSRVSENQKQFKMVGKKWYCFKLFENNHMKVGRYSEFIYDPPIKKPPFDPLEAKLTQSQIDFSINFFPYDMKLIDDQMERFRMLRQLKRKQRGMIQKKEKKKQVKEKAVVYDWQKLPISDRPFIENHKKLYHDRAFEKGFGIDFYIDQARFLPDNVTICKIIVQLKTTNLEDIFFPKPALPDLKTTTFSPFFNYKLEIRGSHFDPTMMAFMTILTVDNTNKEIRIVGYTAINIFLSRQNKAQPTNPLETDIILMDGAYQLPIYCQHPTLIKPFNIDRMTKLDRLPTATLLVRTVLAPMSDDGLKPLGMNDFSQKDWEAKGILQKMPPYGTGYFNTDLCPIRDTEKEIYNYRMLRVDPPQSQIVARLLSYENVTKEMTIGETLNYLDEKLKRDAYTDIIELTYFAKYRPEVGFKISIDGFHKVPDTNNPIVALYSINPPGRLYLDMGVDTRDIIPCTSFNWDSPLSSPAFNEGYFKFRDVPFQKNAHIIIDIRKIIYSERGTKARIEKIGWTLIPLFTANGFVKSGNYQIPVFQGQVPVELVKELARGDPWEIVEEKLQIKKGGLKYLEYMSVIVRLLDGHREGHFQTPFDHSRMIYSLLPQKQLSNYVYNEGVEAKLKSSKKLLALAPNKDKITEFNEKITKTLVDSLGLKPGE